MINVLEIIRYGVKGGSTLLLNIAVMILLVEHANIIPELASIISTSFVIIIGYILMNRFVFPDAATQHGTNRVRQAGLYCVTIVTGKLVNYALFLGLLYYGVWYPLAWLLGAGVVFIALFSANRYLWHGQVIPE